MKEGIVNHFRQVFLIYFTDFTMCVPIKDLSEERDRQRREIAANEAIEANNRELRRRREEMERDLQRQLEMDRQAFQREAERLNREARRRNL